MIGSAEELRAGDVVTLKSAAMADPSVVTVESPYKDEGFFDTDGAFWDLDEVASSVRLAERIAEALEVGDVVTPPHHRPLKVTGQFGTFIVLDRAFAYSSEFEVVETRVFTPLLFKAQFLDRGASVTRGGQVVWGEGAGS